MISIFQMIMAFLNAIPILDKRFKEFQLHYIKQKVESNDVEYLASIKKAHEQKSTKDLQHSIGQHLD